MDRLLFHITSEIVYINRYVNFISTGLNFVIKFYITNAILCSDQSIMLHIYDTYLGFGYSLKKSDWCNDHILWSNYT